MYTFLIIPFNSVEVTRRILDKWIIPLKFSIDSEENRFINPRRFN